MGSQRVAKTGLSNFHFKWTFKKPNFLLLKSLSRVQLFADPWTIQPMEFSRPDYWSGQPFSSPGDLPNPGSEPTSPALQADSLPTEPQGKSHHRKGSFKYRVLESPVWILFFLFFLLRVGNTNNSIQCTSFCPCHSSHFY